eukprot:Gregarina_sp_Poly_1__2746@NODE_175_length_12037_cov_139_596324_g155_i0_p8_GENE_NODE_175_length_12037_cov_139_596324_g155_i0NODE_175_length_12037_cov_139_596324_g155_i0_p8_ORF_typecomplete_len151_score26_86_NODE_175_length_12037_cov_139_596324_g155_i082698721
MDLYYSWYMILKVGGSGWEGMRAHDLPGWEDYMRRKREVEKARAKMRGELLDDDEDQEAGNMLPFELLQKIQQHAEENQTHGEPMVNVFPGGMPIMAPMPKDILQQMAAKTAQAHGVFEGEVAQALTVPQQRKTNTGSEEEKPMLSPAPQ